MEPISYVALVLIFILAGVVPELTGFGVATVSMALLPFLLPLSTAIPLVAIISVVTTGIISFRVKTKGLWPYILPIVGGAVVGVPLGMFFLDWVNPALLRASFAVFLIGYAIYGFYQTQSFIPTNYYVSSAVGVVAGFFSASFNIHGPLVGAYAASNDDLNESGTKDAIATYMFFAGLFTVIGHTLAGRMTEEVFALLPFALPALLVGLYFGANIFNRLEAEMARRIIYIFILSAGIALLF